MHDGKQNGRYWIPFSFYDFFGYMMPGAFLCIFVIIFYLIQFPEFAKKLLSSMQSINEPSFGLWTLIFICLIFIVYILGHFIATIGHVFIEELILKGIVGHPYKLLLNRDRGISGFTESTLKYVYVLFNVAYIAPIVIGDPIKYKLVINVLLVILACLLVFRIIIALIHEYANDDIHVRIKGSQRWNLLYKCIRMLHMSVAKIVIDPIITLLRIMFGLHKPFSDNFVCAFDKLFSKVFNVDANGLDDEQFWLPYHRTSTINLFHASLFRNWLHVYSFARNMSAASFLMTFLITSWLYLFPDTNSISLKILMSVLLCFAWMFGLRYWLLFSTYYTKSVLRSFVAIVGQEESIDVRSNGDSGEPATT